MRGKLRMPSRNRYKPYAWEPLTMTRAEVAEVVFRRSESWFTDHCPTDFPVAAHSSLNCPDDPNSDILSAKVKKRGCKPRPWIERLFWPQIGCTARLRLDFLRQFPIYRECRQLCRMRDELIGLRRLYVDREAPHHVYYAYGAGCVV